MTLETLIFLRQLLNEVTLQVGAPDFGEVAPKVLAAISELDREIALSDPPAA